MDQCSYIAGISISMPHLLSAGCGRTGTLVGLYSIVEALLFQLENRGHSDATVNPDPFYLDDEGKNQERISIFSAVRRIREQRWDLVKNQDQYKYIYSFTS